MISLHYIHTHIAGVKDKEVLPGAVTALEPLFGQPRHPDACGIYFLSTTAGFDSALQFWSDARITGFATANPELFPMTLANGPCSFLARHFQIKGPNVTLIGNGQSVIDALHMSADHMIMGLITEAWIVALDFGKEPNGNSVLTAVHLDNKNGVDGVLPNFSLDHTSIDVIPSLWLLNWIKQDSGNR